MAIIELCYRNHNAGAVVTIVRKTFPSVRASVMRDFFEILEREDIYNASHHNKSESTYILWGNMVEFISVDQPQKIRGRKRDICFINEANELTLEDFRQLILRTTSKTILHYNPSDEFHWIYDHVLTRDDMDFFKTTYLDNPHLPQAVVAEIERLKEADPDYWRVYGLGERGVSRALCLTHWREVDSKPEGFKLIAYGLDFGYVNDPSCLVEVWSDGHAFLFEELLYSTGLSNAQIAEEMKAKGVSRTVPIIADSAEPKSIDQIHGYGFNIHPCKKGRDSVRAGIDFLRSRPMMVTRSSVNGIKELRNYKWREDKNGRQLNEPAPGYDHFVDAARYGATWHMTNPNFRRYVIG